MSIDRGMDKDVVHTYNGKLLGHKKWWNNAIFSDVEGLRNYHTQWSKSEKDKYHNHLYVESKKWYKWTYLQTNRLIDFENQHGYQRGKLEGRDKLGVWD